MLEQFRSLASNKGFWVRFATSTVAVFTGLWTLAEVLGAEGGLVFFSSLALIAVLSGSNFAWFREYITLREGVDSSIRQIKDAGITRREIDYEQYMLRCTREIRLLGLSLHSFTTTRALDLMLEQLKNRNSLSIRILLLDPNSQFAKYRGQQKAYAGKREQYLKETIQQSVSQFRWFASLLEEAFGSDIWRARFDVRLYDGYVSMGMNVFDDDVIASHYFHHLSGSIAPYVAYRRLKKEQSIYQIFVTEFDEIWNDSKSIFEMKSAIHDTNNKRNRTE